MANLLDIYILTLLDRGLETPYSLQREGGLSLGASTPSLRRLAETHLVKRENEKSTTNRPRHVYSLTAAGRDVARKGWREYLQEGRAPTDLDAVLRLIEMALHYGANSKEIIALLKRISDSRLSSSKQAAAAVSNTKQSITYKQMRLACDATRLRAEAQALADLAGKIRRDVIVKSRKRAGLSSQRQNGRR